MLIILALQRKNDKLKIILNIVYLHKYMKTMSSEITKNKPTYIQITPEGISWGFHARYIEEKDGMFSWYLPSFDIYFSTNTKEEGQERAKALTTSFFNYWLKKKGFRSFLMKILRLGYTASSHEELKQLLHRTNLNAKLKMPSEKKSPNFTHYETIDEEGQLAIAV